MILKQFLRRHNVPRNERSRLNVGIGSVERNGRAFFSENKSYGLINKYKWVSFKREAVSAVRIRCLEAIGDFGSMF